MCAHHQIINTGNIEKSISRSVRSARNTYRAKQVYHILLNGKFSFELFLITPMYFRRQGV